MPATDRAPWLPPAPRRRAGPRASRRSVYVPMRDGIRLAVDVHLPGRGGPFPVVLHQTRYFRGVALRRPFSRLPMEWLIDHTAKTRDRFVDAGYAWVSVCARGSGASFGTRPCPWSPDEVADGGDIVDWIISEPWSNGTVGATGVSYAGTSSEFLASVGHPAVRAAALRFCLFDVYSDIAYPGGVHLSGFTEKWSAFNRALDDNRLDIAFGMKIRDQIRALRDLRDGPILRRVDSERFEGRLRRIMRRVAHGVRRADVDSAGAELAAAVAEHAQNFNPHEAALRITCRDEAGMSEVYPDATVDFFSPHARADAVRDGPAALYHMSGWHDGAYHHAAAKRFNTVGGRLILGPWDHGGMQNTSPFCAERVSGFDQDGELIRFFNHHLRGRDSFATTPPVRYFTMGAERWNESSSWPPPCAHLERWHLSAGRTLTREPAGAGADEYTTDPTTTTGPRSRWDSLVGLLPPVGYGDRAGAGRAMLVYRSAPLPAALEVTGHPIVHLRIACDRDDASVFVYLEDESPDGRVRYVTEGVFSARHRALVDGARGPTPVPQHSFRTSDARPLAAGEMNELDFDLLPVSWQFGAGHRLRIAIAGADRDHFACLSPRTLAIFRGVSWVELPVVHNSSTTGVPDISSTGPAASR